MQRKVLIMENQTYTLLFWGKKKSFKNSVEGWQKRFQTRSFRLYREIFFPEKHVLTKAYPSRTLSD